MLRIRRIYFFWIAYCSLSMLVLGITTLARVLIEQLLGAPSSGVLWLLQGREHFREQTALGIALAAIGLPVWLLHWRKAQAWLSGEEGDDERASSLRRLYVYAVLLTTALTGYVAGRDLLAHFIGLLLRVTEPSERVANLARPLPYLLVAMAFWAYHHRIAREDRAAVGEMGASATLRRWYVYGMAVVAVLPLMFNLTELGRQAWFAIFDRPLLGMVGSAASANTVAQCSGTVLAALAVWLLHRAYSEAALSSRLWHGESESHSVLRKVYLYAVVTLTVTWALANAGQVLRYPCRCWASRSRPREANRWCWRLASRW